MASSKQHAHISFPVLQPLTIQLRESQASLGSNMMSIEHFEPTASARECKKRKRVSEAEKAATELSKLVCELYKLSTRRTQECHARFENKRVHFPNSKQSNMCSESCNLRDHRQRPCYCPSAEFRFEASLPDRDHLTRFSVSSLSASCYHKAWLTATWAGELS